MLKPQRFRWPAIFIALWTCLAFTVEAAKKDAPRPGADIFDAPGVVRIQINIPDEGIHELRGTGWGPGGFRPKVEATVSDGERTYQRVALHLKGAAGSFRPVDDRPAMTLNFDKFIKDQTFHGIEKLSLNNSVQDSTYIAEKIARELFAKAGVPVPRTDFAIVTLNGRKLGLYVLAEGYNKQFLRQHFNKTGGNLYDGGFCQDIDGNLTVNSGDDPDDRADLERLIRATEAARRGQGLAALEEVLDVDRFITMTGMEVLLCHWDGYAMNRNNYRLFHNRETGRMVFMPHGLDQLFGVGRGMHTAIFPQMNGMVARAVLGTPDGRKRYEARLAALRTNVFKAEEIVARVRAIEARIRPYVAEGRPGREGRHRNAVESMCRNILYRAQALDEQLHAPKLVLRFGKDGAAGLNDWKPRHDMSTASFSEVKRPDGTSLLRIATRPGSNSASWRMRVPLEAGRYRIEGRAKTEGADGVVLLRISGARDWRNTRVEGKWTDCHYDFQVFEPISDVELVCEYRGNTGIAWFDGRTLKLRKIE